MIQKVNYRSFKLKEIIDLKLGGRSKYIDKGKYPAYGAGAKPTGYCDTWNNDGRITITRKGTVGKIYKREFKHFASDSSFIVEVKSKEILEDYLYEWLLNEEYKIMQLKTPALIPNLDEKLFLNLKIDIPDMERQEQVSSILKNYRKILKKKEEDTIKLMNGLEKCKSETLNVFFENFR